MIPSSPFHESTQHAVGRPEMRYEPRECRLRGVCVWAILTKASGEWTVANCLDREPACEQHPCALVSHTGVWPFNGHTHEGGDR